ncbi:MAG: hypothetical protein FIA92_01425 [Chloroflexi bacterium]|nr:hypothetical protein [Chloroflexota bacterium]
MTPETFISILALTLLATGWMLWLLPVGTCAQCPHCRIEKLAREREGDGQVGAVHGGPFCPVCGRHHRREEDHRF